jgi:hypothetical protein
VRRALAAAGAALATLAVATTASAQQGSPNMTSVVRAVAPRVDGLDLQVLNGDDRFAAVYRGSQPLIIDGYNGEPYARISPDGTVEVNRASPAYYLNQDRTGAVTVPDGASARATPRWTVVDRSGRFEWHDHRMHFMGTGTPAQVKDGSRRQKIFDYAIPIRVGDRPGKILGTLWWTPRGGGGGVPIVGIVAFLVVGLGAAAAITVLRRRRGGGPPRTDGPREPDAPDPERATAEAW